MRSSFVVALSSALIGFLALSSPMYAQQKTIKACQDEWRANRAANQAAGITEKAYVDNCRAGGAAAQPGASPAAAAPAQKSAPPAMPASAPASVPATKPAPAALTPPTGANQFSTEVQAKARCPSDTVVWVNISSKIYHFSGYKNYGNTKGGAYMCERDATTQGFRPSKTEKHPG